MKFRASITGTIMAVTLGIGAAVAPASVSAAVIVADSINEFASNGGATWAATEVGWFYTPSSAYGLVGINTRFGSSDDRTVTVEVYDEHPGSGGILLRDDDYTLTGTSFQGGLFDELLLVAGEDYFIGFRTVGGLGVNVTDEQGAESLGLLRFSLANDGSYSLELIGTTNAQPILQFLANEPTSVPEPFTLALVAGGLVALGATRRRRRSN